jgi:threonine dehydrogenase-like Zn-dependent dehydrogenase
MSPETHQAIARRDGAVGVTSRSTRDPAPGELLLAPTTVGLCGTDIQILRGLRDDPATVLGHEGIATIVAAGEGVDPHLAPATTVVVNPTHPSDPTFLLGHNVDGLWAQRTLVPRRAVDAGLVLPLDLGGDDVLAALLEPLASVLYGLDVVATGDLDTVVVWGDGTIGHLAVRTARGRWPDATIVHVHHSAAGLAWSSAHDTPADLVLETTGTSPAGVRAFLRARCGDDVAAVLATPRDATLAAFDLITRAVPSRLSVDLHAGLPSGPLPTVAGELDLAAIRAANAAGTPREPDIRTLCRPAMAPLRISGHRGVANAHLRQAAAALLADRDAYAPLVTHRYDLAGAAEVMRHLATSPDRTVDGRRLIKLAVEVG